MTIALEILEIFAKDDLSYVVSELVFDELSVLFFCSYVYSVYDMSQLRLVTTSELGRLMSMASNAKLTELNDTAWTRCIFP